MNRCQVHVACGTAVLHLQVAGQRGKKHKAARGAEGGLSGGQVALSATVVRPGTWMEQLAGNRQITRRATPARFIYFPCLPARAIQYSEEPPARLECMPTTSFRQCRTAAPPSHTGRHADATLRLL